MIVSAPAVSVEAVAQNFPTGLAGTLGVRLLDGQGNVTTARTTAGIIETPAASGIYTATLTAPTTTGQYVVVWDDGATFASEQLQVTSDFFTPTAPVTTMALCTLADVRLQLQKPAGDTDQDTLITDLIVAASRAITHWTGRQFTLDSAPSTRLVPVGGYWRARMVPVGDLSGLPSAVTVVAEDGVATTPLDVATDVQRMWGDTGFSTTPMYSWQPVTALRIRRDAGRLLPSDQLQVTGLFGFPAVPEDVVRACIITVALWMRRDVQAFSTTFSVDEGRLERPEALPSQVMRMLGPYRLRPGMA